MTSIVDICNKALIKLGSNTITSIDPTFDNSEEARLCNRLFPEIRDELLRAHPWNFAIKRIDLANDAADPEWGWNYQYPFPSDLLRLLEVENDPPKKVEKNMILTNDGPPINIKYISRIEDPNKYDSLFIDALASKMAYEMAEAQTQSSTKKAELLDMFVTIFAEARKADAQEDGKVEIKEDEWLTVRR